MTDTVKIHEIAKSMDIDIDSRELVKACQEEGMDDITHHFNSVEEERVEEIKEAGGKFYESKKKQEEPQEETVQIYEIAKSLQEDINGPQLVEICQNSGIEDITHHMQSVSKDKAEEIKEVVSKFFKEKDMPKKEEDGGEKEIARIHEIARSMDMDIDGPQLAKACQKAGMEDITHYMNSVDKARGEEIKEAGRKYLSLIKETPEEQPEKKTVPLHEIARAMDIAIDGMELARACQEAGMEDITHHMNSVKKERIEEIKEAARKYHTSKKTPAKPPEKGTVQLYEIARSMDIDITGAELAEACQEAGMEDINHHANAVKRERIPEIEKAGREFLEAKETAPDETQDELFKKGQQSMERGEYEKALKAFKRAIELNPDHRKAWSGKATALSKIVPKKMKALRELLRKLWRYMTGIIPRF